MDALAVAEGPVVTDQGMPEPVVVEVPMVADEAVDLPLDEGRDVLEHTLAVVQLGLVELPAGHKPGGSRWPWLRAYDGPENLDLDLCLWWPRSDLAL